MDYTLSHFIWTGLIIRCQCCGIMECSTELEPEVAEVEFTRALWEATEDGPLCPFCSNARKNVPSNF